MIKIKKYQLQQKHVCLKQKNRKEATSSETVEIFVVIKNSTYLLLDSDLRGESNLYMVNFILKIIDILYKRRGKQMNIPLVDLKAQYKTVEKDVERVTKDILSSAKYIMGKAVTDFEEEFAKYIGVKHAISVGNGTDALVVALKACGIGEGDEVITTPFTFFATAESISFVGATPVFVDVRRDTYNIDPSKIEEKITSKTKAIMPVHIFGQPAQMDEINEIAKKHNLLVIERRCSSSSRI